ncbi:MAG: 2-oxoglutarate and iron-dependent oxygenase domain-containing protein, partial [Chloroflexota bacterium]|nr:2-oxoglutarate and iron-dependent oxygenase domain-containing protein [Chloroflexota bacterium]
MMHVAATHAQPEQRSDWIPIVDVGPFLRDEPGADAVVATIAEACQTVGFFLVTGHGVPAETT